MTNNKRKYGNDKFQSGPLSDQPEINTGLLPGSQEVYVESNVDKSTKSSFLKDIPNWLKWLLLAALLLLAFWVWNNRSNDNSLAVIESTTTSVVPQTTTTTIPNPLDPDYFEPHIQKYEKYITVMRSSGWHYSSGSKAGQKIVADFEDKQLISLAHDVCDMTALGYSSQRIMDYLVGSNWGDMKDGVKTYEEFMPFLYHQALTYICR